MVKPILSIIAIIVTTAMIAILVGLLVSKEEKSYKYIITSGKQSFKTISYTKGDDGCITFQKECGCGGEELETVVLCGTYTIEENKDYDPHAK